MPFSLDPEVAAGLAGLEDKIGEIAPMAVGDVTGRRNVYDPLQHMLLRQLPPVDDVDIKNYEIEVSDTATVQLRWYEKRGETPGAAVLYLPGGGMICSNLEIYDATVARYVSRSGVPFLSVDYRRAPEVSAPAPVTDSFAALQWLANSAPDLAVDPRRIAIMGDSGGGGVAASLAIYARDHGGPQITKQILIYPMLDDRNTTPDPEIANLASWTYDDNLTGWGALLGEARSRADVSPYGAAARLQDFSKLPPAYIEVGELDIFRDESIAYAQGLYAEGISTELHVHPAVPHGFEAFVPSAGVSQRAVADRQRVLRAL